ncbi:MAG: NifU family protein [Bacillota bacterium]
MREKVEQVLEKIQVALKADGGGVELVDIDDGVVSVRLTGACVGCPMASMTLKNGVERILKQEVPEVKEVKSV